MRKHWSLASRRQESASEANKFINKMINDLFSLLDIMEYIICIYTEYMCTKIVWQQQRSL